MSIALVSVSDSNPEGTMPHLELLEETPMADCLVFTKISAEKIYRRDRNIARRVLLFIINIFIDD